MASVVDVMYGVCTNSWERVQRYVTPRIEDRPLVALWNQISIAEAYNQILAVARDRQPDMLVLLHDDLELTDPDAETKLWMATREPDVALVGVAGGRDVRSLAWWNHETVGHQRIETQLLDFGTRTGDVDLLEGSLLAFAPWAYHNLRFDEFLAGFHGY